MTIYGWGHRPPILSLSIAITLVWGGVAHAGMDLSRWLGKQRPNPAQELKSYSTLCERRISHAISQVTSDYLKNQKLTAGICRCTKAELQRENNATYVQVVNMNLRGQAAMVSTMPPELSLYLVDYQETELDCVQKVAGTLVTMPSRNAASVRPSTNARHIRIKNSPAKRQRSRPPATPSR